MKLEDTVRRIEGAGLLPVVRADSPELAIELALALHRGGVTCLEITMTVPSALDVIRHLDAELGSTALVGAGTVLNVDQAQQCLAAGARFIVSPGFVSGLIKVAHAGTAAALIGALTPTEVLSVWNQGADLVKVFPCSALGGASYLKALRAPLPDVKLLPTGGVQLDTLEAYVEAGARALGVGGALADVGLLQRQGAAAVTELAERYVQAYRSARSKWPSAKIAPARA